MSKENSWQLICHPNHPAKQVESIEVRQEYLPSGKLWLRYHIEGVLDDISLPEPANGERMDDLWQTTCCELFLRVPGAEAYGEYNLSPSSRWAAYEFTAYREGMANMDVPEPPEISLDFSDGHLALETELLLPERFANRALSVSFSVVAEETDGTKSFWAVTHPSGEPEFHHRDCFSVNLSAPERS